MKNQYIEEMKKENKFLREKINKIKDAFDF
jgi:hypothetical protein